MKRLTTDTGELLEGVSIEKALSKLSAYEDTGLEPVELSEQITQAIKIGRTFEKARNDYHAK